MASTIESSRLAMDEQTLRKRRDRLFNPITAPYAELHTSLFGPYVPPPLIAPPPPPPPPLGVFHPPPALPPALPPVTAMPRLPPVKTPLPPVTPPKSGKSKEERQGSRSARRYVTGSSVGGSSSESDRTFRRRIGLPEALPSFNIDASNVLSPLLRRRTKVAPDDG